MSIRIRFILIISLISIIAIGGFAFLSYKFTINTSLLEAKHKGAIVSTFLESSRHFFAKKQRPLVMDIVDKDRFYPTIMSGFAVTRGLWDEFSQKLPDYRFKQATLDPLHPPNRADAQEVKLIAEFDSNSSLTQKEGLTVKNGEKFFYYAQPIKVEDKCLHCHGNPENAPQDQIKMYGTQNGYNWKVGSTVAAYITYVPIQKAIAAAKKSALTLFAYGLGGIVLLTFVIWFFFENKIVRPITQLEKRATEISLGKNLDKKIDTLSNDEIGELGKAVERMRISVTKLIKSYTHKK